MFRIRLPLILSAMLCLCAVRAIAQGTQGKLPDPITAVRLSAYADILGLSSQQRHALNDLHAAYRAETEKLREGEVKEWLGTTRSGLIARAYATRHRELLSRIAAVDGRFFDSTIAILTEQQAARLQRVRALRQRERAMQVGGAWVWNDAPPFDLSQAIGDLSLSTDERQAIDATLESYESALTSKSQDAIDDFFATYDKSFDAYERAGWTEERRADPANDEASYAVAKPIWMEWAKQRHVQMNAIVDLNRRTLASVRPMLPPDVGRELWKVFVENTFCNSHFLYHMPLMVRTTSPYAKALERENLTDDQRATLQVQSEEFEREVEAAINSVIEKIQAYRDTFVGDDDRKDEFDARNALDRAVKDAWEALSKHRSEGRERIAALIGPESAVVADIPDPETADFAKVNHFTTIFGRQELSARLPPPVSALDLADYARWQALDETQVGRLHEAHARYLQQCEEFKAKHRPIMGEISDALHAGDTVQGWTKENLERSREANAAAIAAQRTVEAVLFGEVESIVGRAADDAGLQRVLLARERQWLNCAVYSSTTSQAGGRFDGMFDLERVLRHVRGLDLSEPTVDRILADYAQAVAPLLTNRQDAMQAYSRVDDDLRVEWNELRAKTGDPNVNTDDIYGRSDIKNLKNTARKAADPIAALNRATVERLEKALPEESGRRVRLAFEKLTWPRIYSDRFNTAPLLSAAMNLPDVTPQQRGELENAAADYHPAYNAICERMKTMAEGPDSALYDQENASQEELLAFRHRWEERDRVVFERYELNMKVWQRLKGVLTEEQAKAIGMSATPPDPPTNEDQFGM